MVVIGVFMPSTFDYIPVMIKVERFHNLSINQINEKLRKSKDKREYERWICIKCSIEGLTVAFIAALLNRNEQTIRDWIVDFNRDGEKGLSRHSPPGQKKN